MRVPQESLDDFTKNGAEREPAGPPAMKFLRSSGSFEVLKPLARAIDAIPSVPATKQVLARPAATPVERPVWWYRRSVVFSVGVAIAALIAGIVAGLYTPPGSAGIQGEALANLEREEIWTIPSEPAPAALPATNASLGYDRRSVVTTSTVKAKLLRPVNRAPYRPSRPARPSRFVMSSFVPTTLIIYIENGEIRTRTEPQLTGLRKKS